MKTPLKLLPLLLLLALPAAVQAQYTYTANNGTITITGYTGSGGAVTIPSTTNGLPVTSIGSHAFYYCTSLTSVTIPNSVTNIGDEAFYECTSLSAITVDAFNPAYSSVAGVLFNQSQTTLIQCPGGKAGSYTIPNTVINIGDYAFYYCPSLTSVTIPTSVTSIGDWAFSSCGGLTSVTIPNSVTNIGSDTFQGCLSLTSVTIGNRVTSIGNHAFDYCLSLTSVTITNSVTNIGSYAFYKCYKLTSVTIPTSVTSIGNYAFQYCTSLTSVTIPTSVTSIGDYAFYGCGSLTNVMIPGSVTSIGSGAFNWGTSLSAITVDASNPAYSSVAGVLFNQSQTTLIQCPGGKAGTYTIATSVTSIGDYAFNYCLSLTSVTIGNSVTNIGYSAFSSCTNLTSVTIGNSVTSIGSAAFQYCTSLRGVYFQGNAPSVGSQLFDNANNANVYYLLGTTGWGLMFGDRLPIPILPIPGITITGSFPPGPVTNGSLVAFGGSVCNSGNITLTNIFVFSGQPSNTLVLGPLTLAPGACTPFTGSYLVTGGSNPTTNTVIVMTNIVTVTTNTVTPTFGTINPVSAALTDRFNVVTNLHGLMYADQDQNWGPTLFYSTRHPVSGADQFDTISTVNAPAYAGSQYVGFVTNEYNLTLTGYDALTLAAPDVGYGSVNFYYLRHDNSGVAHFGVIKAAGATSDSDLPNSIAGTGYTGVAFALDNVNGYGANMFYYVRNDATTGLSWFGSINPTPGLVATDLYPVGTNFDALVYVTGAPITGWGTDYFAYLRHDNTGSIIGTIDPVTHAATDRVHLGTNFLTGLTFTATDVGYGPNLFYYLRPARTILTTNTVPTPMPNSVVSFTPTNTVTATGVDILLVSNVTASANCLAAVAPVIGTSRMDINGSFSLSFPTEIGKSYTVQYKNTFTDPWTNLPNMPVPGTGGDLIITDPTAAQPSRFYRVFTP
jgi:BspA type Leucine rich repeat region (6 copies)